jgi:hypothetical protein
MEIKKEGPKMSGLEKTLAAGGFIAAAAGTAITLCSDKYANEGFYAAAAGIFVMSLTVLKSFQRYLDNRYKPRD